MRSDCIECTPVQSSLRVIDFFSCFFSLPLLYCFFIYITGLSLIPDGISVR